MKSASVPARPFSVLLAAMAVFFVAVMALTFPNVREARAVASSDTLTDYNTGATTGLTVEYTTSVLVSNGKNILYLNSPAGYTLSSLNSSQLTAITTFYLDGVQQPVLSYLNPNAMWSSGIQIWLKAGITIPAGSTLKFVFASGYITNAASGGVKTWNWRTAEGSGAAIESFSSTTTLIDSVAPTLSSSTPANNAVGIGTNANIVLVFSESVTATAGKNVVIKRTYDDSVFETIPATDARVVVSGSTVTVNPTGTFVSLTGYYVTIDAGAFKDGAANDFAGISTSSGLSFTTANMIAASVALTDYTASAPTGLTVEYMTSNLVNNGKNILYLNAPSGYAFTVLTSAQLTALLTFYLNGVQQSVATYLNPNGTWASGIQIWLKSGISIPGGSTLKFVFSTGFITNPAAAGAKTWNWRTAEGSGAAIDSFSAVGIVTAAVDVTPPALSSATPADNATDVALSANVVLNFSENVTAVAGKNIVIKKVSDNSIFESIPATDARVSVSGSTVTVNPTGTFTYNTGYYVTVDAGAFKDASNNDYAGITSSTSLNFTATADTTPPTLSTSTPADNATGVSVNTNIVLNFSEDVTAVAGKNISVKLSSGNALVETVGATSPQVTISGSTVTINLADPLDYLTGYYVTVDTGAFVDGGGNPFAGFASASTLNFVSGSDTTAPTLSSSTPADGATGVAVSANLSLTFSENVVAVSGKNVKIVKSSTSAVFETIAVSDATKVSIAGRVVSITVSGTYANSTGYHVTIDSGAFQDTAGNAFAGISNATTLNFTTVALASAPTSTTASASAPSSTTVPASSPTTAAQSQVTVAGATVETTTAESVSGPASNGASTTTLPGSAPQTTVTGATTGTDPAGGTAGQSTTSTTDATTRNATLEQAPEAPAADVGSATVLVDGQVQQLEYTRENNQVKATGAGIALSVYVVDADGNTMPLGADGSVQLTAGTAIVIKISGLKGSATTEVWVFSDPTLLGKAAADTSGTLDVKYPVPADLPSGKHRLVMTTMNRGSAAMTIALGMRVPGGNTSVVSVSNVIYATIGLGVLGALVLPASRRRRRSTQKI